MSAQVPGWGLALRLACLVCCPLLHAVADARGFVFSDLHLFNRNSEYTDTTIHRL